MRLTLAVIVTTAMLSGCGFRYEPTAASGEVEGACLVETKRASDALSTKVRGEITDKISPAQVPDVNSKVGPPVAWYDSGVAWYYRPQVAKYVSIDPEAGKVTARDIAGHEVCHNTRVGSLSHDVTHWECMNRVATPTYPRPGAAGTWSGAPFASVPHLSELQGEAAIAYQAPTTN